LHGSAQFQRLFNPLNEPPNRCVGTDELRAHAEIARQHLGGVKYKSHTASASPRALAKAVVRVATELEADLIVLKTHGRRGLSHLILGSVAEEVVRTAPCPVLTLTPAAQEKATHLRLQQEAQA